MLPTSASDPTANSRLREALGDQASLLVGRDNSFALCIEAQQLPLEHVAINLVQRRRDYVEFAERVHTRNDIHWTKITDRVVQEGGDGERPVLATQELPAEPSAAEPATQLVNTPTE